ncbi:Anucleate primary sterigmata protein B [Grifola frondosa]|uniref:Anucleate primary sterigmata protein B n=1 Tax=Grifola frondosa TaxID=5627 RepID=A0A1C7MFC8_GRIFR|nr:Anucleate primary sterigmata protein B [Grifola frondosa]
MSAALNARADTSTQSLGTQPDLSLGSFASGFSTPARNIRLPSTSTQATAVSSAPLSTPSPSNGSASYIKRRVDEAASAPKRFGLSGHLDESEDVDADVLDTPGREKRWGDATDTPAAGRVQRTHATGSKGGLNLTLRDQEKHIDNLKKENFNIKLKVHFLEERLAQLAPDQIDAALKQNINLKIEVQQRGMEMKKLKKLVLELERELERLQRGSGGTQSRARELEEKLEERERELRELRRRRAVGPDDAVMREVEARNAQLEEELENVRGLLEENTEEMERLRDLVEQKGGDSTGEGGDGRWRRHAEELEAENEDLRVKIDELEEVATQRNDEKEDLVDELEALKLEVEDLQRRREAESVERSQSRAQILEEREEREAVEDGLNAVRDKLAAAQIELQQKEDDIEMKNREIEELLSEHQRIVENVEEEWRGEVKEARGQVEELRDVLEQRDAESKELRLTIVDYEANTDELHDKFEAALAHLERESEEKDAEIEAGNREIEKLGAQVYLLEEENDRLKEESDRIREDEAVERERLEALSAALREKVNSLKSQLQELEELYDTRGQELLERQSRQEDLAQHVERLVEELQRERGAREQFEADLEKASKEYDDTLRRERRSLEAKESALQSSLNDLARTQSLLTQRETDLAAVQTVLQNLEAESKKLGESHTTARFSLQLEVDRLKRDVERLEDELARARKELDDREGKSRDRDSVIDKLHSENRDLASQLAAQTQARLNVSEKLDDVQGNLRTAEAEVANFRVRVQELEQRLAKDQRSLLSAEAQYRDQLTERNTLLLTIYQYMDKILGVDNTPKKNGQAETKPFTNFSVFHDNLITRLKALSQIQLDFDKRCKDAEGRYADKLNDMRKQIDQRWKQLDKFEASLRTLAEAKAAWRKKLSTKEGELEGLQATNAALQAQVIGLRKPGQGDSMEVRALTARASNAERRVSNLQNQLLAAEEKMTTMNQKTTAADNKWEARVKEYEARLRIAEEKVKRERQGGKERVFELDNQTKSALFIFFAASMLIFCCRVYQRQIEHAQKQIQQLNNIIDSAGLNAKGSPSPSR